MGVEPFLQPLVEGEEEEGGQLGFLQEVIHKVGDTISKGRFVSKGGNIQENSVRDTSVGDKLTSHPSGATIFNNTKSLDFSNQSCETDF